MSAADGKNRTKDPRNISLFDENRQCLEQLCKMRRLGFVQAITSFGNQQHVCDLEGPDNRDKCLGLSELIEDALCVGARFIFKTPSHDYRIVDHKHLPPAFLDQLAKGQPLETNPLAGLAKSGNDLVGLWTLIGDGRH